MRTLLGALAFTLASSAIYLVNDLADVAADRKHPVKQHRPIASGALHPTTAGIAAVALGLGAPLLAALVDWRLAAVVSAYEASCLAYSFWLKREPVLEMAAVALGFVLRAVGGGIAAPVTISSWFFLATCFGALFVVAGKRYAELRFDKSSDHPSRPVLHAYTNGYLRFVWTLSATAFVVTYIEWVLTVPSGDLRGWTTASCAPFLIVLLRYAMVVDRGGAGEPEEIILGDRVLLVGAAAWLVTIAASIYL